MHVINFFVLCSEMRYMIVTINARVIMIIFLGLGGDHTVTRKVMVFPVTCFIKSPQQTRFIKCFLGHSFYLTQLCCQMQLIHIWNKDSLPLSWYHVFVCFYLCFLLLELLCWRFIVSPPFPLYLIKWWYYKKDVMKQSLIG